MTADTKMEGLLVVVEDATVQVPGSSLAGGVHIREWRIRTGELWLMGGRTGSGKSLVLTAIAGLIPPESGRLEVIEEPSDQMGPPQAAIVFDRGGRLFRDMTIRDNVQLAPRYHGMGSGEEIDLLVESILEDLELVSVADRYPPEIHRSWHARAALARALAIRPKLLLLDDPLAGADAASRRWWTQQVEKLRAGRFAWAGAAPSIVIGCEEATPWRGLATHFCWLEAGRLETLPVERNAPGRLDPAVEEWLETGRGNFKH